MAHNRRTALSESKYQYLRLPFMLERIEIEIFVEDKFTLNELLVTKIVFQYV